MDEVMTIADAGKAASSINGTTSLLTSPPPPPLGSAVVLSSNFPLLSAFLAFAIAQFLKLLTTWKVQNESLRKSLFALFPQRNGDNLKSYDLILFKMIRYKERRWDSKKMIDSGGMPSSHSATVTALAVSIGLQEGTGAGSFAIAVVFACVVMYDASGVRFHAGLQAELLNQIVCEFPPDHPLSSSRPLRDSLGHTPLQVVAGALLGFIVSYLLKLS